MGRIGRPETSLTKYQSALRKIPGEDKYRSINDLYPTWNK